MCALSCDGGAGAPCTGDTPGVAVELTATCEDAPCASYWSQEGYLSLTVGTAQSLTRVPSSVLDENGMATIRVSYPVGASNGPGGVYFTAAGGGSTNFDGDVPFVADTGMCVHVALPVPLNGIIDGGP